MRHDMLRPCAGRACAGKLTGFLGEVLARCRPEPQRQRHGDDDWCGAKGSRATTFVKA